MQPLYEEGCRGSLLLLLRSVVLLALLLPVTPRPCPEAPLVQLPAAGTDAAVGAADVDASSPSTAAAAAATPASAAIPAALRRLPLAAAPQGHSFRRTTAAACVLPTAARLWTHPGAATTACSLPATAATKRAASAAAAAAGPALLETAVSRVITGAAGRSFERVTALIATAVVSALRGGVQPAVAVRFLLAAAAVTAPATYGAAATAERGEAASSVLLFVDRRAPYDAAAAASPGVDHTHAADDDRNFFFLLLPKRDGAPAVFLLLLAHWRPVAFLLLVLLWFAVATWCPVHMLPLLFVPAFVRRTILQQVQEARAVLARAQQQQGRKDQQHKGQRRRQRQEERQEEKQEKPRPLPQVAQQQHRPEDLQHQRLGQRRPQQHRASVQQQGVDGDTLQSPSQRQAEPTQAEGKQTGKEKEEKEADEVRDARQTLRMARNRGMGFLNAVLASGLGTYCLLFDEALQQDRMRNSTILSTLASLLLTSYFTWDLTSILLNWRRDSGQWLLHCVVSLLAIIHPLTATAGEPCMNYYAVALSLFELSTPFLALRYFCLKASSCSSSVAADAAAAAAAEREAETAAGVGEERAAAHGAASGFAREGSGDKPTAAEVSTSANATWRQAGEAAALAGREEEEVGTQLLASAASACTPTFGVVPMESESRRRFPSSPAAAGAATATAGRRKGETATRHEEDAPPAGTRKDGAGPAAGGEQGAEAAAGAPRVGGNAAESRGAGAAATGGPPRVLRLYETGVSVAFVLTFFFVRIVWGNFFLFPEIYAQILSPGGEALLFARKVFFLCAMPVFATLNCFWMILLVRLLIQPPPTLTKW